MAVVGHVLLLLALIYGPRLPLFQLSPEELARRQELAEQQRDQQRQMVFVEPLRDMAALTPPERAPASDLDRRAQAPLPPKDANNPQPRFEGNSAELNQSVPEEA